MLFYGGTLGLNAKHLQLSFFDNFLEAKFRIGYGKTGGLYEVLNTLPLEFSLLADQNFNTEWRPVNMDRDDIIQSKWEEKKGNKYGV